MKNIVLLAFVGGAALGHAAVAHAQTSEDANASITIPQVLFIDVTTTSIDFADPDADDFNTGWIAAPGSSTLEHAGNVLYDVTVSSASDHFDATNAANDAAIEDGDLELSLSGGAWQGLGSGVVLVDDAGPGSSRGGSADAVDYRLLLDYATHAPDDYSLDFTYTIAAD